MVRKLGILAFIAGLGVAQAAQSEEHVIVLLDETFFPKITYVDNGDTIRFVNDSNYVQRIYGKHGAWHTSQLDINEETVITVNTGQQSSFRNYDDQDPYNNGGFNGRWSFSEAPLGY